LLIHLLLNSKYGVKMAETQYASMFAKGVFGEKINSIKSIVGFQGGPGATVLDNSIMRDTDGNYSMQIVAGSNYLKKLADGIGISGYASDVLPVGVSGINKNYDID
jgi:hypothetical protein